MYAENIRINDADFQLHESNIHILFCQSLKSSDIDECSSDLSTCDENAFCFNIEGSHGCICQQGFTGNGTTCEGKCAKYRRSNKKIIKGPHFLFILVCEIWLVLDVGT